MAETTGGEGEAFGRRCVLAAAVLWSLSGAVTKSLELDPPTIAFYRSFFAGLALWPFVPRRRQVLRPAMLPLAVTFGAMIGLYIAAVKATTAANAIFLQCTASAWMVPVSLLMLGERPDRRSVLGIALAMVGIGVIVSWGYDGRPGEGRGVALALASGATYAVVAVGLRGLRNTDATWLSVVNNLGGALTLAAWIGATSGAIAVPTPRQALVLAGFGVVQMAIPYALFARGLRHLDAPQAGLIGLLEPVLNPIWTFLAVGERPAGPTLVGGLLVLAGVASRYVPVGRPAEVVRDLHIDPPALSARPTPEE